MFLKLQAGGNMVWAEASLGSTELLSSCFPVIIAANATCFCVLSPGCKHHRVTGSRQGGGWWLDPDVRLWHKLHFLPSILTAGERYSNENRSSQTQVSIMPFLISPTHCSCDLRALSAPHGGRKLHRAASMACRVVFCTFTPNSPSHYFFEASLRVQLSIWWLLEIQ